MEFLRLSAESFDSGFEAEAKRIAATLRILLHDKNQNKSLLGQLNQKNVLFHDTAIPETKGSFSPHNGLIMQCADQKTFRYVPFLDNSPAGTKKIPFEDWWNAPVFETIKAME